MRSYFDGKLCRRRRGRCALIVILAIGIFGIGCSNKNDPSIASGAVTVDSKNPLPDLAAAAEAGKPLYAAYCVNCHGENGDGDGIAKASLPAIPSSFVSGNILNEPDGKLFLVIKEGKMNNGKMTMPPVRRLSDGEIWQVIAYVRTMGKK